MTDPIFDLEKLALKLMFWKHNHYDSKAETKAIAEELKEVKKTQQYPEMMYLTVGYSDGYGRVEGQLYRSIDSLRQRDKQKVAVYVLKEVVEVEYPAVVTTLRSVSKVTPIEEKP